MDNNPPDNTESKDKSKPDQVKPETLSSSDNKKIFKFKYLKLLLEVGIGAGIIITISISISISTDLQSTNTNVNALSNDIATMSTSLSSANAKSDSQAIVNNTFPLGSGNATIYHKFQNPVQACWYYAATYRTQHPYTVLWEIFSYEEKLKIRAIASKGIWKAHTCQIDKEVDLEKIEDLLIDGDASISKDAIEKIKKDAKAYKSVYDIRDLIGENKNKEKIIKLVLNPEENENIDTIKKLFVDLENNESEIRKLLEEGYTKDDDKKNIDKINKIIQAIRDNKKLDEIKNKIKNNINRFRIIGLILKPNTIVKLIGEETINHRLETTFYTQEEKDTWDEKIKKNKNINKIKKLFVELEKNESEIRKLLKEGGTDNFDEMIQTIKNHSDYSHIADTVTTYYSTLHFDNEGKIAHRRIKKTSDYKCIFPDSFDEKALDLNDEICTQIKKSSHNPDNSDSKEYKNEVEILKVKTSSKESEDYNMALKFYLEKRKELHHNLTNEGCGAISVEPDFVSDLSTGELETPSLVFLCHKNNIRSHVRIMVRENQQQKKEREDKTRQEAIQEAIQEAKKEWQKMNEQSSEE